MVIAGDKIAFGIDQLKKREHGSGGFVFKPQGRYVPEATCWAILALSGDPANCNIIMRARARLAADQLPDGRVCVSRDHPEVFWPTSLAIFAWHQSPEHQKNQAQAASFLLGSSGEHSSTKPDTSEAHDTALKGWPWIAGTHSWVEPTALAIMALRLAGYGDQARVREGARLLLDRQLPHGGWNYGNTLVFGQELRPLPMSTAIALNALKSETPVENIQGSLNYLNSRVVTLHTPRSLGWSLLGLGAWQMRPMQAQRLISECLNRQERYGVYDTSSLALLLLASQVQNGLEDMFLNREKL